MTGRRKVSTARTHLKRSQSVQDNSRSERDREYYRELGLKYATHVLQLKDEQRQVYYQRGLEYVQRLDREKAAAEQKRVSRNEKAGCEADVDAAPMPEGISKQQPPVASDSNEGLSRLSYANDELVKINNSNVIDYDAEICDLETRCPIVPQGQKSPSTNSVKMLLTEDGNTVGCTFPPGYHTQVSLILADNLAPAAPRVSAAPGEHACRAQPCVMSRKLSVVMLHLSRRAALGCALIDKARRCCKFRMRQIRVFQVTTRVHNCCIKLKKPFRKIETFQ